MKINTPTRLTTDDLSGDWKKDKERVIGAVSDFQEQATRAINGKLCVENTVDFADTYDLDHGVETRIKNPLDVPCKGIIALRCVGVELGADKKPTRKLYSLAVPRIDWEKADSDGSNLLVTATYPLTADHTSSILELTSVATALPIAPGTATIAWNSPTTQVGSDLSWASGAGINSKISVATSARYLVSFCWDWDTAAAGYREGYIVKNGSTRLVDQALPGGSYAFPTGARSVNLIAGDYIELLVGHTAAAALGRAGNLVYFQAQKLRDNTVITARGRVTLYFFGG